MPHPYADRRILICSFEIGWNSMDETTMVYSTMCEIILSARRYRWASASRCYGHKHITQCRQALRAPHTQHVNGVVVVFDFLVRLYYDDRLLAVRAAARTRENYVLDLLEHLFLSSTTQLRLVGAYLHVGKPIVCSAMLYDYAMCPLSSPNPPAPGTIPWVLEIQIDSVYFRNYARHHALSQTRALLSAASIKIERSHFCITRPVIVLAQQRREVSKKDTWKI